MSAIWQELNERGLVAQSTDADTLSKALNSSSVVFYVGFDPTAPSLHVGNLVQILTAKRLQLAGHKPLLIVGGATGLIGDPKPNSERALVDVETVNAWVSRLEKQLRVFFNFEGPNAASVVNNLDWTKDLGTLSFLRDIGKHFSVNRMLDREAVSARLAGEGISYTEFSYQVLQANDYLELFRRYGATLQTGGSDQWGNITAGCDLIRRVQGAQVHALTTPLVTKADGTKFGKTEGDSVWLDASMTSPYDYYQFWLNTDDRDIEAFTKMFSLRSLGEIQATIAESAKSPAARLAQRELAFEMTALAHGEKVAAGVQAAAAALFGNDDLSSIDAATLEMALGSAGMIDLPAGESPPIDQLLAQTNLVESLSAARRAVKEGGAYLNNERVSDPAYRPVEGDFLHGRFLVLRRGKKSFAGARRKAS
ncbi:MAG: tyrosine--tRNA ligase [Actinobacteria bacterium]|nr:tyrosine--tRNA ligase [Actinomycetota bacterium]